MIGSSQVNLGRGNDTGFCNFSRNSNAKLFNVKNSNLKGCSFVQSQAFLWPSRSATGFSVRAASSSRIEAVVSEKASEMSRATPNDVVELYVGLPLDTISCSKTINHARAIAAGLKALKLLGVNGVELPVWWGLAEGEAMGKYDWSGYLALVEMVQNLDLKLHMSLCFHGSEESNISLPEWVSRIGESHPSIYFTDRSGQQYKNCLSLGVDDLPVLDGKTPLEVYKGFFENFKSAFLPFMGSTITGLSIGLGPDGELRYPSHHNPANSLRSAGEFQCYDKNMLLNLKQHAETHGNPLWGLGGPHDAPRYDQSPLSGGFFSENGGSWQTPYGDFFLSWYSSQLACHSDRILSLAASTFKDASVSLSGKIPLMHTWSNVRSHPSELTAGLYNTVNRDGYSAVAEIFSRNSCNMIIPGMDLSDEDLPSESCSSPESLLAQIMSSCRKHGTNVSGQNISVSGSFRSFEQIKKNLSSETAVVDLFMYQRMGAYFFSPEHFPAFTQFMRSLNQPMQSLDDLPVEGEANVAELVPGVNLQLQTA